MISKKFNRGICIVMAMLLMLTALASCRLPELPTDINPVPGLSPNTEPTEELKYTLTEAELEAIYRKLDNLYVMHSKNEQTAAILKELDEINDGVDYVYTQNSIARLLSSRNTVDPQYKKMLHNSEDAYIRLKLELCAFYAFAYKNGGELEDKLFENMDDEDVSRIFRHAEINIEEVIELRTQARELYAQADAIDKKSIGYQSELDSISKQIISANNAMARAFGYDNYVEFVSEEYRLGSSYLEVLEGLKSGVVEHLIPLVVKLKADHETFVSDFSQPVIKEALSFTASRFDLKSSQMKLENFARSVNMTVFGYYCDLMDRKNYYLITDDTVEGLPAGDAFTEYLPSQGKSVMYFGKGNNDILSFIHQLGHYCTAAHNYGRDISPEIRALQAEGAEYLYLASIRDDMSEKAYEYIVTHTILATLTDAVTYLAIGELEHTLYTMSEDELGNADISKVFDGICNSYMTGTDVSFAKLFGTRTAERRNRVVSSNFFTSLEKASATVSALELYSIALNDYSSATRSYFTIQFYSQSSHSSALAAARLHDPCSSDICKTIGEFLSSDFLATTSPEQDDARSVTG